MVILEKISNSVPAEHSRTTRRNRLLPVFVYEILTENTSRFKHYSQASIRNILNGAYCLDTDRRTVSRCLSSLCDEELGIFGDPKSGYWYDRKGYYPE